MTIVAPLSTGLGVITALFITGTELSRVMVLLTEEVFPAASVAVTTRVLLPSARVIALLKLPFVATVTEPWAVPLSVMVIVTGLEVLSLVVPVTVTLALLVIEAFVGAVIFRVGGTVSTLYVVDLAVAALPSLSLTVMVTV